MPRRRYYRRYSCGYNNYSCTKATAAAYFKKHVNTAIPELLYDMEQDEVEHCIWRTKSTWEHGSIQDSGDGIHYEVQSFNDPDEYYDVSLEGMAPDCSCPDWSKQGRPCKHIMAVFVGRAKGTWMDIPEQGRLNPPCLKHWHEDSDDSDDDSDDDYGYGYHTPRYYEPMYTEGTMRYTQAQMKAPGFFKTFPNFLHKKPSAYIKHCRWRTRYRHEIGTIEKMTNGFFQVQSMTDKRQFYQVKLGDNSPASAPPSCNCPDWEKKGWACKHILAILMYYEEDSGSDTSDNEDDDERSDTSENDDGDDHEDGQDDHDDDGRSDTSDDDEEDGNGTNHRTNGAQKEPDVMITKYVPARHPAVVTQIKKEKGVKVETSEPIRKTQPGRQVKKQDDIKPTGVKVEVDTVVPNHLPGRQSITTAKREPSENKGVKVEVHAAPKHLQGGPKIVSVKTEPGGAKGVKVEVDAVTKHLPGGQKIVTVKSEPGEAKVKVEAEEMVLRYRPGRQSVETVKRESDEPKDGGPPEKKSKPHDAGTTVRKSTRANRGIKKAPLYE